ncbi:MAG: hypothetical protein AAF497_21235, partial [Planctomycetota bacterium]
MKSSFCRTRHLNELMIGVLCLIFFSAAHSIGQSTENGTKLWEFSTKGDMPLSVIVHPSSSKILYVAAKSGGLIVLKQQRTGPPQQIAQLTRQQFEELEAMNLFVKGNRLFVALGDFFRPSEYSGAAVIDISAPEEPRIVGLWKSPEKLKGCAAIVADASRVYLGGMHFGIHILRVTRAGDLEFMSTFQPDPNYPVKNPGPIQRPNARGFALRRNQLFVANDSGGLRILDVSKETPKEIARYVNSSMEGKQQAYNSV